MIEQILRGWDTLWAFPIDEQLLRLWHTLLVLYEKGGIIMLPLGLCSLLMMVVILERLWVLRLANIFPAREITSLRADAEHHSDRP